MCRIIEIEKMVPHTVSEVICVSCMCRWLAVRPKGTLLKDLHCKNCGPGYVIETGQELYDPVEKPELHTDIDFTPPKEEDYRGKNREVKKFNTSLVSRICQREGCENVFMCYPNSPKQYCSMKCFQIVRIEKVRAKKAAKEGRVVENGPKTDEKGEKTDESEPEVIETAPKVKDPEATLKRLKEEAKNMPILQVKRPENCRLL